MWRQVRTQALKAVSQGDLPTPVWRTASLRLLEVYGDLAQRNEHLLGSLLAGQQPKQWVHYPENDAIDPNSGFQWFYHSHAPADRADSDEHGHLHLFAQKKRWSRRLGSARETQFAKLEGGPELGVTTRHLLCIGFDAKGLPSSLFTVNSWVTGDLMLSAATTAHLIAQLTLSTGNADVDAVVTSVVGLYRKEIRVLLDARDKQLFDFQGKKVLADTSLEVLSALAIHIDEKLAVEPLCHDKSRA